jgi:hypothetical protein
MSTMQTMPPREDAEGKFFVGHAIAFRFGEDGAECVLMCASLPKLKAMHRRLFEMEGEWKKARRVECRPRGTK